MEALWLAWGEWSEIAAADRPVSDTRWPSNLALSHRANDNQSRAGQPYLELNAPEVSLGRRAWITLLVP